VIHLAIIFVLSTFLLLDLHESRVVLAVILRFWPFRSSFRFIFRYFDFLVFGFARLAFLA
jgi:hypothetical protein